MRKQVEICVARSYLERHALNGSAIQHKLAVAQDSMNQIRRRSPQVDEIHSLPKLALQQA